MFFDLFFKRTRPRGLSWTPRYFDPDSDEDLEYERRQTRIQFEQYRRRRGWKRRRGMNPFILLVFVFLAGAVIWTADRTARRMGEVKDARMTPVDAVPEPAPATATLLIERDTVRAGSAEQDSLAETNTGAEGAE
ncbi:MAG: hypothetical protein MAG453_00188 [Calditrichaeota bacterium]|nr:hypothetical protein [Calditrichota bacterium]